MARSSTIVLFFAVGIAGTASAQPYPPSTAIAGVTFDASSHDRRAPGSDNWPLTWGADDHQYTSWGDGGGFGGTNSLGRVSLGVARVEGPYDAYEGYNVWGGNDPEAPATFGGKSYGLLSLGGDLYMWVQPGSDAMNFRTTTLYRSTDLGRSWTAADWSFADDDELVVPTILQFGMDYAGARDSYVYVYAIRLADASGLVIQRPGAIDLLRAPTDQLMERDGWEFFAGLDGSGEPTWTADIAMREPVFEDPAGVGWTVSVSYNAPLGRYILCTEHDESMAGNLGVFDAPEPWGPWTTVGYYTAWEGFDTAFFWNFSNKWLSADGLDFTLVFTGTGESDSWNAIRGRFTAGAPPADAGVPPPADGGTGPGMGDAGAPRDGGGGGATDSGAGGEPGAASDDGGCSCSARSAAATPLWLVLAALALAVRRARARALSAPSRPET